MNSMIITAFWLYVAVGLVACYKTLYSEHELEGQIGGQRLLVLSFFTIVLWLPIFIVMIVCTFIPKIINAWFDMLEERKMKKK
jgi:hypothetical protein